MVYIQYKCPYNGLETIDEFTTYKEAKLMIKEYRLGDKSGCYYLSSRACKAWKMKGERMKRIVKHNLPAYWVSYLINDDGSGLSAKDLQECETWLKDNPKLSCLDCTEESTIMRFDGLLCDCLEYSFISN